MLKPLKKLKAVRIILFFLIYPSYLLVAQSKDAVQEISRYISHNLPIDNQNWNIYQNPQNGLVYFANSAGLGEYNGISLKIYTLPYRQSIRSVYVSGDGTVFTGSFEEFGYWRDTSGGNLTYRSLSKNIPVEKNDEIWKIYELNDKIFFQSFTTIYCYDYNHVKPIKAPFTMLFLFHAGEKFVAQVLSGGLYWFDGNKFDFIEGSGLFKWLKVHSVIKRSGKELWICTANNGIYRFDGDGFSNFDSEISTFLTNQTCNAGLSMSDSLYVFGTISDGIVFCDNYGRISKNYNYINGLRNNTVLSLFKDKSNGLWIGLDDGANYLNILSPRTLFTNSTGKLGTIYTILRDKDKLYLGTNHGLFEAVISQVNEDYSFSDIKLIPHTQGQVWTLERYDNQILCGHNDGTFLLDGKTFRQISDITGGWSIRQYNDLLIEGTYTGIIFLRKDALGKWTFRNKIKGFSEPTRHIEVDYLGYIWASHPQKGIYKLELNEALDSVIQMQYFKTVAGKPTDIDICKVNNQIVFTAAESIYTFDYEQKSIIPFSRLNQTLDEYKASSQIVSEMKNNYWFIKGNKIALFEISKDFSANRLFVLNEKFSDLPERELHIIQLSDKTILIPARQAFTTYNLSPLKKDSDTSWLKIRKLVFRGKKKSLETTTEIAGSIRIPYYSNNLTAFFDDPSQFDNENKEYQYRLQDIEENWHKTIFDSITYLNLPHGNYLLQLKSEMNNSTDEINFTIEKPWYLKPVAFIFYFLLFMGVIILTIWIFRIELKKQRQLIEFEVSNSKLVSELDFKSYELMLTMRYLTQKNEILTELHKQITSLKDHSTNFPVKFINEMEKIINHGLDSQTEEWKNTMKSLKLSQQGFFKCLIETHPNLTPNDLRLCSYLRMNFTTKEIARLLNISGRAVEISRYRLRRKMNLDHNINLTEYLIKETDTQD
ncbi:MAG: triple tyrosine motif-containing protein [Bacteroidales bacterium]|nr:triple tyrosine motif-containing protein [Bacteroidales bacterium]